MLQCPKTKWLTKIKIIDLSSHRQISKPCIAQAMDILWSWVPEFRAFYILSYSFDKWRKWRKMNLCLFHCHTFNDKVENLSLLCLIYLRSLKPDLIFFIHVSTHPESSSLNGDTEEETFSKFINLQPWVLHLSTIKKWIFPSVIYSFILLKTCG